MNEKKVEIVEPKNSKDGKWWVKVTLPASTFEQGPFNTYKQAEEAFLLLSVANIARR